MKGIGIGERRGRRYLNLALRAILLLSLLIALIPNTATQAATPQPYFIWPVDNPVVSSGSTGHPPAMDITGGSSIYASAGGKVIVAGWDAYCDKNPPPSGCPAYLSGGWMIDIDHGNGWTTRYAHLSKMNVGVGAIVTQKQVIGVMGNSGHYQGQPLPVHLHFEGRLNNTPTNITLCSIQPGDGAPQRDGLYKASYDRNGGLNNLGCASNSAHWWGDSGTVIQDFPGKGTFGAASIIHDQTHDTTLGTVPAYTVHGPILTKYNQLRGASSYLGAPTSEQFTNASGKQQSNFSGGYITLNGTTWQDYKWPATGSGWRLEYRNLNMLDQFRGITNFDGGPTYVMYKPIPTDINQKEFYENWSTNAPGSSMYGVWKDNFLIRATALVKFLKGTYDFVVQADDGIALSVCGKSLVYEWHKWDGKTYPASYTFTADTTCTVAFDYFEGSGSAFISIDWKKR